MPRLLDLFCGAGLAADGYAAAGFTEIVGIDIRPQPKYPFHFVRGDALRPPVRFDDFDMIHASPPCQEHTRAKHLRKSQGKNSKYGDLLTPTLKMLRKTDVPFIVENVPGAPGLGLSVRLCGSSFGMEIWRHRYFMCSFAVMTPPCQHRGRPWGIYHVPGDEIPHGGRTARDAAHASELMGCRLLSWDEIKEGIPPAYTEYLGRAFLKGVSDAHGARSIP